MNFNSRFFWLKNTYFAYIDFAKLFFLLEDIPSLIATLTKVAEDSQKTEFQNQVDWQVNELKKGL